MIEITVPVLHELREFSDIRLPPRRSDGNRHLCRFSHIHYGGDSFITLQTTDGRTALISRFPILGAAEPWTATVEAWRLSWFIKYIEGGRRELGLVDEHNFAIDRLPSKNRLHNFGATPSFPTLESPKETCVRQTLAPDVLAPQLAFIADGRTDTKLDDRTQSCLWDTDGLGVASCRQLDLAAILPKIPFAVHLRKQDCRLFADWLKLVQGSGDVQLCRWDRGGSVFYRCQTADGSHVICLTGATRTFPRELVDVPRAGELTWATKVERDVLKQRARLFGASAPKRLVCELSSEGAALLFRSKRNNRQGGSDHVPAQLQRRPRNESTGSFEVGANALVAALSKFTCEHVYLGYRAQQRRLSVTPADGIEYSTPPKLEAIVRTIATTADRPEAKIQ